MSQVSTDAVDARPLPGGAFARTLVSPLLTLAFLVAAPTDPRALVGFALVPFSLDLLAARAAPERRQPAPDAAGWRYDLLLAALVVLHVVNLALAVRLVAGAGLLAPQVPTLLLLLVISSSITGAVPAHELIHRRGALPRLVGRALLCTMFFEHFFTEHLRGHHARVGTPDDPSTARRGEPLWAFLGRAVPGQLAAAWRLERRRLAGRGALTRAAGNAVAQGLAAEAALCAAVGLVAGPDGLGLFVAQGVAVNFLYQVVIYLEHWGLERSDAAPATHSWDTTNGSTLFSLVGLARHADHHLHPARPFHALRHHEDSPKLPGGYGAMIALAVLSNARFQRVMTAELARRELDPSSAPARTAA